MPNPRKPFLIEHKPILCKIGVHRWGEKHLQTLLNKRIEEWEVRCLHCDEVKRWTRHKRGYTFKE